jgi:hypothetical protein
MNRRNFLAATGVAAGSILAGVPAVHGAKPRSAAGLPTSKPGGPWFEYAWRRAVIDMHIPDWDPKFLSEFNADRYVEALVQSRAQSIVCYAHSHAGVFNYPTKVGRQHAGLNGRDIVAEMIDRCHRHNIAAVLYVSVIHDRWASGQHPDWRIIHPNGGVFGQGSRHGFVCPNSPCLRLPQRVQSVRVLPSGRPVRLRRESDGVTFTVPRLNTLLMLAIHLA